RSAFVLARLMLWGIALASCLAGAWAAQAQTPTGRQVQVRIDRPQAGEVITGSEVLIAVATTGDVRLTPGNGTGWSEAGEFHVFLDGVDVLQTPALAFSIQPVAPGPHTLRVDLQ